MAGYLFAVGIFLSGIFIRIIDLDLRSLWRDEAWVAILASSDSLSTSFFTQWPVPPLFVSSLYLSVHLFKNNEFYLRIIPALFGIGGMALIYYFCLKNLGKAEAIGALLLSSFLPVLVAYSMELKQYTGDIFFTLLLLIIADHLLQHKLRSLMWWGILAVSGAIGLWFSYPLIFVVLTTGLVSLICIYRNGPAGERRRLLFCWLAVYSVHIASFLLLYFTVINNQLADANLESFWRSTFPDADGIIPYMKWAVLSIWGFFEYFWNKYTLVVLPISLFGIIELIKSNRPRIIHYWGMIFLFLLISSSLHLYPFGGNRANLFTAPFFIIIYIAGMKSIWRLFRTTTIRRMAASLCVIILAVQMADAAIYYKNNKGYLWYTQYPLMQDMRTAISVMEQYRKDGEAVYVYYGGDLAFEYYSRYYYKKPVSPLIVGKNHRDNPERYADDLVTLIENRKPFWLLATHIDPGEIIYIDSFLSQKAGYMGRPFFGKNGALLVYYK